MTPGHLLVLHVHARSPRGHEQPLRLRPVLVILGTADEHTMAVGETIEYAKTNGLDQTTALQVGMAEKSAEFLDEGARVYLPIDELTHAVPSTRPSTP